MTRAIGASTAVDLCDSSAVDCSTLTLPRAEVAGSAVSGAFDPRRPWLNPSHRIGEELLKAAGYTLNQQRSDSWTKLLSEAEATELLAQLDQRKQLRSDLAALLGDLPESGWINRAPWAFKAAGISADAPLEVCKEFALRLEQAKEHRSHWHHAKNTRLGQLERPGGGQSERPGARSATAPPSRRGRPRRNAEIPGIYGNRQLDRALIFAGLTPAERTIARKILSLLRAEYTQHQRGKIITRQSLGSRSAVARTFRKLRVASLITHTHRISNTIKGRAASGVTNLGPAFFDPTALTSPSGEGPKMNPRSGNFDTPKPPANTGKVDPILDPRFRNPLKRVPMGAGPTASAPLRAAASRPAPSETHQQQISSLQSHPENTSSLPANPIQSKPTQGSTVLIEGREGRFIVKGFSWGDSSDQDSVRCVSVESSDTWITAKMSDVTVVA